MKNPLLLFIALSFLVTNCTKNNDNLAEDKTEYIALKNGANDFVWKGMNSYYLWQDEVIELSDDRFANQNDYYKFLNGFSSPTVLFQTLKSPKDRYSVIVEDYDMLFNYLSGVSTTNGIEYIVTRKQAGSNKVVGVVRYVMKGSDAETKGVKRGDIFYGVNGIELFAKTDANGYITASNFNLFNPTTYTLNFAKITKENKIVPNNINIELTKSELTEDPILVSKTLEVNGTKIGYLMYNSFTSSFDEQLNKAFGRLKADNINELVLDLRYNSGGSVQSATRLASMITGQFTGELFAKAQWNDKWKDVSIFKEENNFVDNIKGAAINSLSLKRVYIIATDDSASSSELVINSLDPYIEVIHIGDVTEGKIEFSVTLVDTPNQVYPQGNIKLPYIVAGDLNTVEKSNPSHKYALQPLVSVYCEKTF